MNFSPAVSRDAVKAMRQTIRGWHDACRAMVQWAAGDAKAKGIAKPKFLHTGDNHPYPNAPKEACGAFAKELGFEVLTPVVIPLKPGDFKAQCLTIKDSGAN